MKLKKVLAAALAGTMVMASAATVFAAETIETTAVGWWADYPASSDTTIEGDGTWTYSIALASYSYWDEDSQTIITIPPNFCVELTSSVDGGTAYITSTCAGDVWYAETGIYDADNSTGDTDGTTTVSFATGDIWTVTIARTGQDFLIEYYQNGTKVVKQNLVDSNMADSVNVHLLCQTGALTYEVSTDGSTPEIEAYTEDFTDGVDLTQYEASTESTEAEDTESESESTAASSDDSSDTADEDEGGISPVVIVVIVVVVVVVIVVIVMATKKKK